MDHPWNITSQEVLKEIMGEVPIPKKINRTIWGQPKPWTEKMINKTYQFENKEANIIKEDCKMIDAYFLIFKNTDKDRYNLSKTMNGMTLGLQEVIAFLNMLLAPKK